MAGLPGGGGYEFETAGIITPFRSRKQFMTSRVDWSPGQRASSALQVHLLGMVDLDSAIQLQERTAAEIADRTDTYGVLLVCEHASGVTVGREGSAADLLVDRAELESRGVPVRWSRRGGGAWAHHPGQIVIYLILPLNRLHQTADEHRRHLSASLLAVGQEQRILVDSATPAIDLRGRCGSLGFVGASVADGVSRFGGCLNVSVPRAALNIVSWGQNMRPSSLAAERMRPTTMAAVRECWIRHLARHCGYDRFHLWTGHPLLKRTTRRMFVCNET